MTRVGNAVGGLFHSIGLLILRLGFGGVMMYAHGWGKLAGFAERSGTFADPFGAGPKVSLALAIGAEVVCAALVMIGLATRIATIPLIVTMAVAGFMIHAADPFDSKEKAFLFLTAFVALLFTGPGMFSVDALWTRRRQRKAHRGEN